MRLTTVSAFIYNTLFILLFLCLVLSACSESSELRRDIITNENTEADLGKINEEKGIAKARLVVANPTRDTLYPVQAFTLCTCLKAKADRQPVPPCGDVLVEIDYNPSYKQGIVMEEVQVIFDGSDYLMSLIVKGNVLPCKHPVTDYAAYDFGHGLHISQEVVPFGKLAPGESASVYVNVANGRKRSMHVGFQGQPANLRMRSCMELGKEGRDTLHLSFTMPEDAVPGDTLLFPLTCLVDGRPMDKPLVAKAIVSPIPTREN